MRRSRQKWIWAGLFIGLFALSLDFWRWEEPIAPGFAGFPDWMGYFVLLQVAFVICLGLFIRLYWQREVPVRAEGEEELK